jgi:hypothetical protein
MRSLREYSHSGRDFCIDGFHKIQNHVNNGLIADPSIDHGVVNSAVRPFNVEILLDKIGALAVDDIHQLLCFLLTLAASQEAPHFIFSRGVKKHAQRVWAVPEKVLRPSSNDDRVSGFSGVLNDRFRDLQNAFAVDYVELVRIQATFITPAQKRFKQTVVQWIVAFLSNLDDGFGAIGKPGDLLGQQLIPKFPAQLRRKQVSDFAPTASVLPLNCDDFDHAGFLRQLFAARDPNYISFHFFQPTATSSTHRRFAAATGIIFFQEKCEKEHDRCTHGQNHKHIDVGQTRCLRLHALINPGIGSRERVGRA